ncbi:MAG: DUF1329 domain-containing protein [Thermodesulfobacteriota bacterium]|nr:DUF1329 domain-containing protein [Thermodesulfobacteriota bacterium]
MKKIFLMVWCLVVISELIWAQEYKIEPDKVITRKNYEKYLPELKRLFLPGPFSIVSNGLKNGWITVPVVEKRKYPLPKGFIKATRENTGKLKVGKDNQIIGDWKGGVPFPHPKTGAELGWNAYRRRECGEDFYMLNTCLLFDKKFRQERSFTNYFFKKSFVGRTDFPPIPEIPGNNGLVAWKESMLVIKPYDIKGFSMIRTHYEDIYRDDDVFSYIPAIRRIRRLTGSDVTDPMLGSDTCYDDFEGWHQKINSRMSFKMLGTKKFLTPRSYTKKPPEPYIKTNCYQVEWEIRPLCILEIQMNDPGYAYKKRILYLDKEEGSYPIAYGETYDLKGRFWRSNYTMVVRYYDPESRQKNYWGCYYADHISGHTTPCPMQPVSLNLGEVSVGKEEFTITGLIKKAR